MDPEGTFPSPEAAIVEPQQPDDHSFPLVLASPHSGSEYPADFLAASRLDAVALRRSEDSFVHQLFSAAPRLGAPLLSARFARAYLHVNREAYELDPSMFADPLPTFVNAGAPRVRMGLGTVAPVARRGFTTGHYGRRRIGVTPCRSRSTGLST
jgi:N-formylglutamate amidohydrolase